MRRELSVDFDGVIHSATSPWEGSGVIQDPPVEGAIEFLVEAATHFNIVVCSCRAGSPEGRDAILEWLTRHWPEDSKPLLWNVTVTNVKPWAVMYIDDKGYRFEGKFPTIEEIKNSKTWNRER